MNLKLTLAILLLIYALVCTKGGRSGHRGRHGGHSRGRGGHSRGGHYSGESYEDPWYDGRRISVGTHGDERQVYGPEPPWSNSESED